MTNCGCGRSDKENDYCCDVKLHLWLEKYHPNRSPATEGCMKIIRNTLYGNKI